MERVQFQQEQMLPELRDLVRRGLFSLPEVKAVLKKRTAFEAALVRRIPRKSDFLRYAEYELALDALRRRRAARLPPAPPSLSDYALVRRQFEIFERALRKFRADVALWVQYLTLARRAGAHARAGRVCARALQLHPHTPALYVLAAQHEPAPAARVLLQRGLRLNAESVALWAAYVQFELGFVERMRRRWDVLGVGAGDGDGDAHGAVHADDAEDDAGADAGADAEEARREVMRGGIVKTVIDEAAKAIPQVALFEALDAAVRAHPTPPALRAALLAHLDAVLLRTLPGDAGALVLHATRGLRGADAAGAAFVDALRAANEALLGHVRARVPGMAAAYAAFVAAWCARDIDENLRLYLEGSRRGVGGDN